MTEAERRADPVREFLRSGLEARLEVRRHQRRTAELESRCARLVAQMTGMPAGGGAGLEATWAALADERQEEQRLVEEELRKYHEVERFIARLSDPARRTILRLRYLEGLSWTQIHRRVCQEGLYYSERQIFRLHGAALKEARELWAEDEEVRANEVHTEVVSDVLH